VQFAGVSTAQMFGADKVLSVPLTQPAGVKTLKRSDQERISQNEVDATLPKRLLAVRMN
jgi:hypothetical protein